MTPEEIKAFCESNAIRFVDVKFVDLFGQWQHITRPIHELNDWSDLARSPWRNGYGFDGSSIRGFQKIEESDMLLVPDPDTALIDPFIQSPTLSVIANVEDPVTRARYSRDARYVAQKSEQYVKDSGVGDTVYIGPELEFFIFDEVRFDSNQHSAFYSVDSDEGIWNSGAESTLRGDLNQGYRPRYKEGYFPVSPHDTQTDIRNEMVEIMEACGIQIELHHHEVATAGQATAAPLAARRSSSRRCCASQPRSISTWAVQDAPRAAGIVARWSMGPCSAAEAETAATAANANESVFKTGLIITELLGLFMPPETAGRTGWFARKRERNPFN